MKKKGFGELFKNSFDEYGDKFIPILKTFVFVYLIPVIVLGLIGILSAGFILGGAILGNVDNFQDISQNEIANIISTNLGTGSITLLVLIFVLLIIGFIVFSLLSSLTYINIGFSKKPDFKESFAKSRKDFWRYLGLACVMTVFLFVLFFLLIVPGIIFMVYWIFAMFVLVNERKGIMDSLKRSFNLVKGRWWLTFGYFLLINIIAIVVTQVAQLIPLLGTLVAQLVVSPFMIFFIKNYYLDVKESK